MRFRIVRPTLLAGALLFILFSALAANLAQRDYEFLLDPDFQTALTRQWNLFFSTHDPSVFTKPNPYPYYDGQPVVAGAVSLLLEFVGRLVPQLTIHLVRPPSFYVAATTLVNVLSYAGAGVLFYSTMLRLTGSMAWAALMSLGFFLSPQMIAIDVIRNDFQIMLPLMAVVYVSVLITQRRERHVHAFWLGVSLAFLATIKVSGLAFGLLPALAYISLGWPLGGTKWRQCVAFIALSVGIFIVLFLLLMFRYLHFYSLEEWIELYPRSWRVVSAWPFSYTPRSYYNVELLLTHGREFIVLYIVAAAVLLYFTMIRRSAACIFILLSVTLFSAIGAVVMKYQRGGYHLLPFIYLTIGIAIWFTWHSGLARSLRVAVITVTCLTLTTSVVRSAQFYKNRVHSVEMTNQAVNEIWRPFRSWISANAPTGNVCIHKHSEWGVPHIDDITAARFTYGPFDFPYLDPEQMAKYEPPDLRRLRDECEVLVLNDYHKEAFAAQFRRASADLAHRWDAFYAQIEKAAPPVVLSSAGRAGAASRIEIYDVRTTESICDTVGTSLVVHQGDSYLYASRVPQLEGKADSQDAPRNSPVVVCENNRRLGPAHSAHEDIRRIGRGAYSHWGQWILFSSSDNTDPATNGRTYHYVQRQP